LVGYSKTDPIPGTGMPHSVAIIYPIYSTG
jgi:hypothetical protein